MGWYFRGRWALTAAGSGLLTCVLLAVGCQTGPFLQTEQYVTRGGQEEQVGRACISVEKGSGMGGGRAPGVPGAGGDGPADTAANGHSFSYEGTGSAVRLTVVDGSGTTLADKSYDGVFIASGRKDEVTVDTGNATARFVAWGVPQCGQTK